MPPSRSGSLERYIFGWISGTSLSGGQENARLSFLGVMPNNLVRGGQLRRRSIPALPLPTRFSGPETAPRS